MVFLFVLSGQSGSTIRTGFYWLSSSRMIEKSVSGSLYNRNFDSHSWNHK